MKYVFNRQTSSQVEEWTSREYLLTNGRGGYASSTLADCPTRKYHGLLALPDPASGKTQLYLSKIELSFLAGTKQYDLSTNMFPGSVFPEGYRYIQSVSIENFPETVFSVNDGQFIISKSVLMPQNESCVLVSYTLIESSRPVILKLMPLLAYRETHQLIRQNALLRPRTYFESNGFKIDPYLGLPALFIQTSKTSTFFPSPDWWKNFEYGEERSRGYEYTEDLFTPGVFEIKMKKGDTAIVRAGLDSVNAKKIAPACEDEIRRLDKVQKACLQDGEPLATLKAGAGQFVTTGPSGILAGFPWFTEVWGRDAMISLQGLLLCCGRFSEAFNILTDYGGLEKNGLLPNIISAGGHHAYNSLDTPFLFFRAVRQYLEITNDKQGVGKKILPFLVRILTAFTRGLAPNARIGEDGLLYGGNEKTQLTWMDACSRGTPVTSRHGAAVEINALYYQALALVLDRFSAALRTEDSSDFSRHRQLFEKNFQTSFWNEHDACLFDVYRTAADRDPSIRPNQLFALTLPDSVLDRALAQKALETVKMHLVTPYGLRTLSPRHPDFVSDYQGNQDKRDAAYHQGMIWPWLIGPYFDAARHHATETESIKKYFRNTFSSLWERHLEEGCVRQISEIFTPVVPHRACGCPAQAWSLAESIRILHEIA
jgi:predicted glycogen debranching enzyme